MNMNLLSLNLPRTMEELIFLIDLLVISDGEEYTTSIDRHGNEFIELFSDGEADYNFGGGGCRAVFFEKEEAISSFWLYFINKIKGEVHRPICWRIRPTMVALDPESRSQISNESEYVGKPVYVVRARFSLPEKGA